MEKVRSNDPPAAQAPRAETSGKAASQGDPGTRKWPSAEDRRNLRYLVSADAVVIDAHSNTRLRGRATDIGLGGCYLDAISVFAVGASVGLRLTTEARSFECEARVIYSLLGMGMGLMFTKISPDQATLLRHWIAELSGESRPAPSAFVSAASENRADRKKLKEDPDPAGCQEALSELISLLRGKGLLDKSEAAILRDKLTR
jgi:hypothetical protein